MDKWNLLALLVLVGVISTIDATADLDEEFVKPPKPFGIGRGSTFIGGRETDKEGTEIALKIYRQFIQYKRIVHATEIDEEYYGRFTDRDQCVGRCPEHSSCHQGICVCNHYESHVQAYGRCWDNITAVFLTDNHKYRIPEDEDGRPDWCFCGEENMKKIVCHRYRNDDECKKKHYSKQFDHTLQFCSKEGKHHECQAKDINMICSNKTAEDPEDQKVKNQCQCRKDMEFDYRTFECRIFLDVDCTEAEKMDSPMEIMRFLEGTEKLEKHGNNFDPNLTTQVFCNLIDSEAEDYTSHLMGEFTIFGLTAGGVVFSCLLSCCACCFCCRYCKNIKAKIRSYDPRYIAQQRLNAGGRGGVTTEMAALGAVAAGEYLSNQRDLSNQAAVAAMQGVPGYAPPGPQGYTPQGPQGYAPPPYPGVSAPGPYMAGGQGYAPVPTGQGLMGMAPELALAGAGAYSGNNTMTALGVTAAMERVGQDEDEADMMRAGALRGVPPPPGYPGAAQPIGSEANLPPTEANYPRQKSTLQKVLQYKFIPKSITH